MHSLVKVTVADFDQFMDGIKASQPLRDKYGVSITAIYRLQSNENQLFIVSEYKDEESANNYFNSDELAAAMKQSSIISEPEMWKVNKV